MLNEDIFYLINTGLKNPVFDVVMPVITQFGSFVVLIIFLVALILYAKFKNKKTLKKVAILALIALLFSDLIVFILKNFIHEPRPFLTLDNVHLLVPESDPNSFPSGHTASTVSAVTIFVLNMKKLIKRHIGLVNLCLIIFALIIPFSRIYVGVHYPHDVLAGAVIGLAGALILNHFKRF